MQCWHEDDPPPRVPMRVAVAFWCAAALAGIGLAALVNRINLEWMR